MRGGKLITLNQEKQARVYTLCIQMHPKFILLGLLLAMQPKYAGSSPLPPPPNLSKSTQEISQLPLSDLASFAQVVLQEHAAISSSTSVIRLVVTIRFPQKGRAIKTNQ